MAILPRAEDVIRIEMLDAPTERAKGEGQYEWRHLKTKLLFDVIGLEVELRKLMPGRQDDLLDRLQNFHKIYINTRTGEVST